MSRLYFHSEHGDAALRGSERAYMGVLCSDLMLASIGDLHFATSWLVPLLPPDSWIARLDEDRRESSLRIWLGGMGSDFIVEGERIATWLVSLNTALAIGNDVVCLFARLHGQCEIHCWIDGLHRHWLAQLIRTGRATGLMRSEQGWESVADLLDSRTDGPVVCSYSVCDQFPNFACLPDDHPLKLRTDNERYEDFYTLSVEESWRVCMAGLRAQGGGLELHPDCWSDFRFESGHSAFSLPRK